MVFVGGAAGEIFYRVGKISAKAPKPPHSIPAPAIPNSSPLLADFSCAPNCKRSLLRRNVSLHRAQRQRILPFTINSCPFAGCRTNLRLLFIKGRVRLGWLLIGSNNIVVELADRDEGPRGGRCCEAGIPQISPPWVSGVRPLSGILLARL